MDRRFGIHKQVTYLFHSTEQLDVTYADGSIFRKTIRSKGSLVRKWYIGSNGHWSNGSLVVLRVNGPKMGELDPKVIGPNMEL